jgi:hypothetical protein
VGGDEIDLCADISGELTLFELKDKEFSLGNAYSFGAKLGIVRPDHPVIVTTEHVGGDAKEHFERAEMSQRRRRYGSDPWYTGPEDSQAILFIEGIEHLRSSLESLVSAIYTKDATRLLGDVLPRAAIDPRSLLEAINANEGAATGESLASQGAE